MGYIDYVTLVDAARAHRERLLEEELWSAFVEFAMPDNEAAAGSVTDGAGTPSTSKSVTDGAWPKVNTGQVKDFLQLTRVRSCLVQSGIEEVGELAEHLHSRDIRTSASRSEGSNDKVSFIDMVAEVISVLPPLPPAVQAGGAPVSFTAPVQKQSAR